MDTLQQLTQFGVARSGNTFLFAAAAIGSSTVSLVGNALVSGAMAIGTNTNFNAPLELHAAPGSWGTMRITPLISGNESSLGFSRTATGVMAAAGDAWSIGQGMGANGGGTLSITSFLPGSTFLNALNILPTGSVGIGKLPGAMLDVAGDTSIASNLMVGNQLSLLGGTASCMLSLFSSGVRPGATSTSFYGLGMGNNVLRHQGASLTSVHAFYGSNTEFARVTGSGLGVLQPNVAYTLDINGSARFANDVFKAYSYNLNTAVSGAGSPNVVKRVCTINYVTDAAVFAEITILVKGFNIRMTRRFQVPLRSGNDAAYQTVTPFFGDDSLGAGNDCQLLIQNTNFTASVIALRWSLVSATAARTPAFDVSVRVTGSNTGITDDATAQSVDATSYQQYPLTPFNISNGTVTISNLTTSSLSSTSASLTQLASATITANSLSSNFGSIASVFTSSTITANSLSSNIGSITSVFTGTLTAGSLTAVIANMSTLTVGTILNFSAGGSIGTNLFLTGTLTSPAASITSLVVTGNASMTQAFTSTLVSGSISASTVISGSISGTFASLSTLTVGTILNFNVAGTLGTNLTLTGTLVTPLGSITSTAYAATLTSLVGVIGSLTFGSFLGVNTANPVMPLEVNGSARVTGSLTCTSLVTSAGSLTSLVANTGNIGSFSVSTTNTTSTLPLSVTVGSILGTSTGDQIIVCNTSAKVGNNLQLQSLVKRSAVGTDWTSSSFRVQTVVDATSMTYQDYNASGNSTAIAWGSGGTEYARLVGGRLGIGTSSPQTTLDINGSARVSGSSTAAYLSTSLAATSLSDASLDFSSGRDYVNRNLNGARVLAELNIGMAFGSGSGTLSTVWSGTPTSFFGTIVNQSFFPGFANGAIRIVGGGGQLRTSSLFDKGSITNQVSGPNPILRLCILTYYPLNQTASPGLNVSLGATGTTVNASAFGAPGWQFVSMDVSAEFSNYQTGPLPMTFRAQTSDNANFMYVPWFAIVQDTYVGSLASIGGAMSLTGGVAYVNGLTALSLTATSLSGGSGTFSGSVTANYLTATGGLIGGCSFQPTAIGINTITPTVPLDVFGSARVTGSLSASTVVSGSLASTFGSLSTLTVGTILNVNFNAGTLGTNLTLTGTLVTPIASITSLTTLVGVLGSSTFGSFLGVNTANPSMLLDVNGSARVSNLTIGTVSPLSITPGFVYNGSGVAASNSVMFDLPALGTISFSDTVCVYGNVGINNVTPVFSLDVSGSARATGSLTAGSGTFSGTVTANYFTAGGGLIGGSIFQPTAIGINTTSPTRSLDVVGSARVTGTLTAAFLTSVITTAGSNSIIAGGAVSTGFTAVQAAADTTGQFIMFMNGSARSTDGGTLTGTVRNDTGGDLRFVNASGSGVYVRGATGFCGINNVAPTVALDVTGSCRAGSLLSQQLLGQTSTQATNDTLYIGPTGGNVFLDRSAGVNGSFIFNYNTPVSSGNATIFQVYNGSTNRQVLLGVNSAGSVSGSNFTYINSGLSVGQSSAPAYSLDVVGSCRLNNCLVSSISNAVLLLNQNQAASAASSFALYQGPAGDTVINSASGSPLLLKVGNVEYARLASSGLLGVNTTTPAYPLDVNGSARIVTSGAMPLLIQTGSSTSNGLQIQLSGTGGAQDVGIGFNQVGITSYGIVQRAGANGRLAFVNNLYPGSAGIEQVSILASNGNVGIGNTAPAFTLDVNGSARITGTLTIPKQVPWTNLPLNTAVATQYGGGFGAAQYCKDALGIVRLRGLINVVATGVWATLPSTCWPASGNGATNYIIIPVITPNFNMRELQISFNGNMQAVGTAAPSYWVSLENASWDTVVQ